ncbi:MAG TPA: DUF3471 domain-containing protein [Pyrinomonadaceae bacterium]|jgi:hypothetical protein
MKRLLVAMLCVSALAPFAYGATLNRTLQEKPAQEQKEKKNYDVYVGQYEVAKDFILTITNEDGKLMGQPTGETKAEFKPEETAETFFSSEVNARLKFATNAENQVTGVLVSIGGRDYWAKKIK